jgi:hypothetical protein
MDDKNIQPDYWVQGGFRGELKRINFFLFERAQ